MIRSLRQIAVQFAGDADTTKLPKGVRAGVKYPVVVERSVKKKKQGDEAEFEDLEFGIINDENKVVFCAMYRVYVFLV